MSGRNRANHASPVGSELTGNSDPAKNQGTIAIAGVAATNSSTLGTRLARISATPYIPIASAPAPPTNHSELEAVTWNWAPRRAAATTRATS